jgi:hypothetical protein
MNPGRIRSVISQAAHLAHMLSYPNPKCRTGTQVVCILLFSRQRHRNEAPVAHILVSPHHEYRTEAQVAHILVYPSSKHRKKAPFAAILVSPRDKCRIWAHSCNFRYISIVNAAPGLSSSTSIDVPAPNAAPDLSHCEFACTRAGSMMP